VAACKTRCDYEKPEMTEEDGMKLGELEGIVGEEMVNR